MEQAISCRGMRVLLVDDEPEALRAYERLLRQLGTDVVAATNAQEAQNLLDERRYSLVLTDIRMPGLSGPAFLRAIRERDLDVPVVLMTGVPDTESAIQAVEYGAFRYLLKPIEPKTLSTTIIAAARLHELARLKREALQIVGVDEKQLGDLASLDARFTAAVENLWTAYQPIVHWPERRVLGYEVLMRSEEPTLRSPLAIIGAAERLRRLHEIGRQVRALAASGLKNADADALLFVNLHAADLNDDELFSSSSPLSGVASRVVLEITERASLVGVERLSGKLRLLRNLGYRIAVDDLGAGYAGLSSFSQLEPEFVKLDMSLIRGLDRSARKRSVVRAMIRLCSEELGVGVICEGVETAEERSALEEDGGHLLQGYLFARPEREPGPPNWN